MQRRCWGSGMAKSAGIGILAFLVPPRGSAEEEAVQNGVRSTRGRDMTTPFTPSNRRIRAQELGRRIWWPTVPVSVDTVCWWSSSRRYGGFTRPCHLGGTETCTTSATRMPRSLRSTPAATIYVPPLTSTITNMTICAQLQDRRVSQS